MELDWLLHVAVALILIVQIYGKDRFGCKKNRMIVVSMFCVVSLALAVVLVMPIFTGSS